MSKYAELRAAMGGTEYWNDKGTNGRILKWYADTRGADKAQRKAAAEQILAKLHEVGLVYVQKVVVRNAETRGVYYVGKGNGTNGGDYLVREYADYDKIAVYIDAI